MIYTITLIVLSAAAVAVLLAKWREMWEAAMTDDTPDLAQMPDRLLNVLVKEWEALPEREWDKASALITNVGETMDQDYIANSNNSIILR